MRFRSSLVLVPFLLPLSLSAADSPRETLAALNLLRVDPQAVYTISSKNRIEIHEPDVVISLTDGKLGLFEPFEGRVTGFVFFGIGHILALPRDPIEKQQ